MFRGLLLPAGVQLPSSAANVVEQMRQAAGQRILSDGDGGQLLDAAAIRAAVTPDCSLQPSSDRLAMGQFQRDGHHVLLLVNVGKQAYDGAITTTAPSHWLRLDPHSGDAAALTATPQESASLHLDPHQACLLVD